MTCPDDNRFGPLVVGCRDDLDFTKTFQQLILSVLPNALFITIAAIRIVQLARKPRAIGANAQLLFKAVTGLILLGIDCAYLFYAVNRKYGGRYPLLSVSVAVASSVMLLLHSRLAHTRMSRASDTITIFLFISLLCDTVQLRTHWLSHAPRILTALFVARTATTVGFLALEAGGKSKKVNIRDLSEAKEKSTLILSKAFTWWMNDLVRYGYGHDLTQEDLYPLDEDLAAEEVGEKFMRSYRVLQRDQGKKQKQFKVFRALISALGKNCARPILPRLFLSAFKFAQPFFIGSMMKNLSERTSSLPAGTSVAYVGLILFINVGNAMSTSMYSYYQERAVTDIRSSLVPALYQKTLRRKTYSEKNSSVISLMNSEVSLIQFGARSFHEFWVALLETTLASWLLQRRIGVAFLAPVAVILASTAGSSFVGRFASKRQKEWMDVLGARVGLTSAIIPNLPSIKMAGLGYQVGRLVQLVREQEIKLANRFRLINTTAATFSFVPMIMGPIVTFTLARGQLTMTEVMTSLAFINLVSSPMILILQTLPHVVAGLTSISRMEEFLDSENDRGEEQSAYRDEVSDVRAGTVKLDNASFGWDESNLSVQDIHLSMSPGNFTHVVGPVAAGKTTLCLGLLDEVKHRKGDVTVNRGKQASYCNQDAFIINGTIRENIIMFAPFRATLYAKIVKACQLQTDFETLSHADETVVGSQGAALSGGQKKRISLARSLYAEPEFAILDDVLGGVDSHTARGIAEEVFGPTGILRELKTTVLYVSQSTELIDLFDTAVVMKSGKITWSGPPAELPAEERNAEALSASSSSSTTVAADDSEEASPQKDTEKIAVEKLPMIPPGVQSDYSFYLAAVGPWVFTTFVVLAAIGTSTYVFSTLGLEVWISAEGDPAKEQFYFRAYWALQISCLVSILAYFTYTLTVMGPIASSKLHFGALKTLILAPLDYYTTVDSSVATGYMSQDMNVLDTQFTTAAANTLSTLFFVLFQSILIILGSPAVIYGYPIFMTILYVLQKVFLRTSVRLRSLAMEGRDPISQHFMETLDGLTTIRAFGWSEHNKELHAKLLDKSQQSTYLSGILQTWLKIMLNLCVALVACVFVAVGSQLPASTGLVGVALVTFMSAGDMLANLVQSYAFLQTATVALNRLKFFAESVSPEDNPVKAVTPPELWPAQGVVQLSDVSAGYKTSTPYPGKSLGLIEAGDPADAIKAVSLNVKSGENMLICGRTGSGKSTLLRLLQGFINPHSGTITIDGITPAGVVRNQLRDSIIALPQSPFFLPSEYTVRQNLEHHFSAREFNLAETQEKTEQAGQDEDCIYALQAVGLWETLSARGGLDVQLKEGSLSRGEKQLFSLARAILRQRLKRRAGENSNGVAGGLLLLDEFNTGLDSATEALMWAVIKAEFASCTIICVAHRLGAASDFDHVLVMSQGSVVEEGVPATLLEQADSKFRVIWNTKEI